jgi:hypothetical protein
MESSKLLISIVLPFPGGGEDKVSGSWRWRSRRSDNDCLPGHGIHQNSWPVEFGLEDWGRFCLSCYPVAEI